MQFVPNRLAFALFALACLGGCSRVGNIGVAELGDVLPNETVAHKWQVVNTSDQPMVLGGFDEACGCKAWVDGNPVIPANGQTELNIKAVAAGSPGPHGVYFSLTTQVGSAPKQINRYVMKWTAAKLPAFEPAVITFKQGVPSEKVVQVKDRQKFRLNLLKLPRGISIGRDADILRVNYDGKSEAAGRVEFEVGPNLSVSFATQVEAGYTVALQPWRIAVKRASSDKVRTFGKYTHAQCPPGLSAHRQGDLLRVEVAKSCPIGAVDIALFNAGEKVATIPVEVLP